MPNCVDQPFTEQVDAIYSPMSSRPTSTIASVGAQLLWCVQRAGVSRGIDITYEKRSRLATRPFNWSALSPVNRPKFLRSARSSCTRILSDHSGRRT